ncbi:hypothetical protein [Leifsonia sp. NPDC058230]|uniref:hypothetical protein n=1 Tax=Leifsonia sp. NPDC058230 TaxID=3346391 RepID=UPI0036DF55DA
MNSRRSSIGRLTGSMIGIIVAIALCGGAAPPASASAPASVGSWIDNSPPAVGCPQYWTQVAISPPVSTVFVCSEPGGHTYLFNDSDQVWNIADYDAGRHVVTTVFSTPRSDIFQTTFAGHYARLGLAAPRDVVQLPDYYHNIRISPHQNLTVAWNQQIQLETAVLNTTGTALATLYAKGSTTRTAVVKCALAAWTGVKGTQNVVEEPELENLIVTGLGVTVGATGCKKAINAASNLPDSRLLEKFDAEIVAANRIVKQSQTVRNTVQELFDLVVRYFPRS